MNIEALIREFIKKSSYAPYKTILEDVLLGNKEYSLNKQEEYANPDCLEKNIYQSVRSYKRDKDSAIKLYKDLIGFLNKHGVNISVDFPPISISSTFDRRLFIAKYLQDPDSKISDLEEKLWVSARTIENDIASLRGNKNPISVNGKQFIIPDTNRNRGRINFSSTAHPLFLTENLTQIVIMLKGLKAMASDPLYDQYAKLTASEIWWQLSPYAKERIRFVLREIIPDDLSWYESLAISSENSFQTERDCSTIRNNHGADIVLDCLKNGKTFFVEYDEDDTPVIYKDCKAIPRTYEKGSIDIDCSCGHKTLKIKKIIRSAYSAEELLT